MVRFYIASQRGRRRACANRCCISSLALVCSSSVSFLLMQVTVASWTCANGHVVEYDGADGALFSLRKKSDSGGVMVFTRSFCDRLVSFV